MYLTGQQKIKCMVGTIFFLLFFGYFRPFFINIPLNSKEIVINSLLFFLWLGYSYAITNTFIPSSSDDKSLQNL